MNTIMQDVINLSVFDEEGKFITKIETSTGGILDHKEDGYKSYLLVRDALFNLKMLEAIGEKVEKEHLNDFDKYLSDNVEETVIKFKKLSHKERPKFKLVGDGIMYSPDTMAISHDFKIVIPEASYTTDFNMEFKLGEAYSPSYVFRITPYNDEGDMFDVRLKARK